MTEEAFVATFLKSDVHFPRKSRRNLCYVTEVRITTNRVDIVYFERKNCEIKTIMAVEAKLKDWRRALQQAHRDKLFAERTYVALPEKYSAPAIANIDQFRRALVGLIIVGERGAKTYYDPPRNTIRSEEHVSRALNVLAAAT